MTKFLEKLKFPLIFVLIVVTIITVVSLTYILLNVVAAATMGTIISLTIYFVNLSLAIYFAIVCYKITKILSTISKTNKRLKHVTNRILVVVVGIFGQLVTSVYVGSARVSPIPFKVVFLFVLIFSLVLSFAQILAFIPAKKKQSTTSSKKGSSTNTEVETS